MAGKGGGGAWKVAYADFVTAMMAFFLVMWITAQSKPVKQAIAQYFSDPYGTLSSGGGPPAALPSRQREVAPTKGLHKTTRGRGRGSVSPSAKPPAAGEAQGQDGRKPSIAVMQEGDNSSTGIVVIFAEASADLDERARARLNALVPMMLGKINKIEIRGHSTARPLPSGSPFKDAWELSYARCVATLKFLEQAGIESERMRLSQGGPYEPQQLGDGLDRLAENARVEVKMLGEFVDDLKGTRRETIKVDDDPQTGA
jgi:chemotaxis protein MotB